MRCEIHLYLSHYLLHAIVIVTIIMGIMGFSLSIRGI